MTRGMRWTKEQLDAFEGRTGVKIKPDVKVSKQNKYRAVKTVFNGREYDSKKEAARAAELQLLRDSGEIALLFEQQRYSLDVNGEYIADYISDFSYTTKDGERVIEDVKSAHTRKLPVYRIKKKLMKAIYNIEIKEV